nr:hypothetical protein [Tanacetum cinerariifolium]
MDSSLHIIIIVFSPLPQSENKLVHLEQPLITITLHATSQAARDAYEALFDAQNEVACLMLGSMSLEIQRALEKYKEHDMIQEPKTMFEEQAKQELFKTVKAFHAYKQEDGQSDPEGQEETIRAKGKDKGKNKLAYAPSPRSHRRLKERIQKRNRSATTTRRKSRKLKHGVVSLYVRNRMHASVEAIRSFELVPPSGLIILLENCHFAPTITKGVVSISHLVENGYIHTFTNYGNSVSKDNVIYFNAIPHDVIYEIDMNNLYPNVSSTYNVSNKRAKHALDSTYLWHYRLGHINKKHMEILQSDGILQPTHDEALKK